MSIYVNRILNLKRIKAIGFDMDYTLVRYHTEAFEKMTHQKTLEKLVQVKNYDQSILNLPFDFSRVIQGLVIDRKHGNILKVSRFGNVRFAVHGTTDMSYQETQKVYRGRFIDLNDENIQSLDTSFSISNGVLFGQLVALKDSGLNLPDYEQISYDIKEMLDLAHSDGTLKSPVRSDIEKFILPDSDVATVLERYKSSGKKLMLITNSDFHYAQLLMEFSLDPYLKESKNWLELFDIIITLSSKPRFFTDHGTKFLKVDPQTGLLSNYEGKIEKGIFQGGNAKKLQNDLGLLGEDILYLGDHIYGDVVTIKKASNWRTGMVLDPLEQEILSLNKSRPIQEKIDALMEEKEQLEKNLNNTDLQNKLQNKLQDKLQDKKSRDNEQISKLYAQIENINQEISDLLEQFKNHFNPFWGEMMRAGQEESRFADQVEKYACIYMSKVSDLINYAPKTYFRPKRRSLPHELGPL